jgi:hypothetical protein
MAGSGMPKSGQALLVSDRVLPLNSMVDYTLEFILTWLNFCGVR